MARGAVCHRQCRRALGDPANCGFLNYGQRLILPSYCSLFYSTKVLLRVASTPGFAYLMHPSGMPCHKYIQKVLVLVEVLIIFLVIAFLLVSTVPGLLRVRKRSPRSKIVILPRSSNPLETV